MKAHRCALLLLAALAGCQGANPYQASHLPYPAAPHDPAVAHQADPGSYPSGGARDFAHYRSWQWQAPAGEPLAEIVSAELDQRGLRPATAQSPAGLLVRAQQHSATRQQQVYDDPYFGAGYGSFGHHAGYWGGAGYPYPMVRTITYQIEEVQLEFFDARSGAAVWSGSGEAEAGHDEASRTASLRRAVHQALSGFPPP